MTCVCNESRDCWFWGAGMSLQEWVESRSRELQTKEKRKAMEKGQTPSADSKPEVIEVTWQEVAEQVTIQDPGEADPVTEEEVEVKVPLLQKRRRLTKVSDMVPAREDGSTWKVVPARDGASQRDKEREVREDASAQERPWVREETEEARADCP